MAKSNVELVRRCAAAFNRGDLDEWASYWDPDAVFEDRRAGPDQDSLTRGLDNIRAVVRNWREAMPDFGMEIGEIIAVGEALAYWVVYRGSGETSAVETELPGVDVCWISEGRVTYLLSGLDSLEEARRAVADHRRQAALLTSFRAVYEQAANAFNDGDLDRALGGLAADFEWHAPEEDADHDVYRGPAEIKSWFSELRSVFDVWRIELRGFEQLSDNALLVDHVIAGTSRGAGVPVEVHTYEIWEFDGMRPVRARQFLSRDEALASIES